MKLILSLSLIWMLLSTAAALRCCTDAQCSNTTQQNCTTERHCVTAAVQGFASNGTTQTCAPDAICSSNGLFNFSLSTTTINASSTVNCCNTDNCNSGNVNVPGAQAPNNLQCFSCNATNTNCSTTIQCKGAENNCFRATETVRNVTLTVLGCASANLCTPGFNPSSIFPLPGLSSLSCCQGSLCNSAPAVATTAHLLLALLVFSLYQD